VVVGRGGAARERGARPRPGLWRGESGPRDVAPTLAAVSRLLVRCAGTPATDGTRRPEVAERCPGSVDVVVGMGLNVGWAPPPEVAPATCVRDAITDETKLVSPHDVLLRILDAFDELESKGDDAAFAEYENLLTTTGKQVRCELPGGAELNGRAVGVERDGRLRIIDECAVTHRIDTADVVHLRGVD